jgi:hypothetical protein
MNCRQKKGGTSAHSSQATVGFKQLFTSSNRGTAASDTLAAHASPNRWEHDANRGWLGCNQCTLTTHSYTIPQERNRAQDCAHASTPAFCTVAAYLELDLLQGRAAGLGQQAATQSDGALLGACTNT